VVISPLTIRQTPVDDRPRTFSTTEKRDIHKMAKASGAKKEEEVTFDIDMPDDKGFTDETKVNIDGWYSPVKGKAFMGQLVGRVQFEDEDGANRDNVLVRLSKPFDAVQKGGETVKLEVGQVLAVGIRANLKELLSYVEHRGTCFVGAMGQKKIKAGRTIWEFKVLCKGKKSNPPTPVSDDDDIPF
jgi:hypothetical protein